eukprot:CAMPEP_0180391240 /NCGR_PEP_ID=MMETSP0989-20121125/32472_1 /TAXON_ID=697907 /ORGANISM="non described non described, Strain CCMP2293" /LENGTH=135 /DNA_ID=CAMNT_0022392767 /DNA_START=6 /DNA_END=410 /DNA_ORIENTATION=-
MTAMEDAVLAQQLAADQRTKARSLQLEQESLKRLKDGLLQTVQLSKAVAEQQKALHHQTSHHRDAPEGSEPLRGRSSAGLLRALTHPERTREVAGKRGTREADRTQEELQAEHLTVMLRAILLREREMLRRIEEH